MFRHLRWRIAIPYIAVILVAMFAITAYVSRLVLASHQADLEAQLLVQARLIADQAGPVLREGAPSEALTTAVARWAEATGARVTIIAADGRVLGDSHADLAKMDNHLSRPEVQEALRSGEGVSIRRSDTLHMETMYAAALIRAGEETLGIARVAWPMSAVESQLGRLRRAMVTAAAITSALALLLAIAIATRTTRPVARLTAATRQLAAGNWHVELAPDSPDEVGELTAAFNHMARELRRQMTSLSEERSRLRAVLDHMADGVLITDSDGAVRLINPAAARLLGTSPDEATGRPCAQVLRHHELIDLWREGCHAADSDTVETVEITRPALFLRVIVTPLRELAPGDCLMVLQDLTQIRRLETVRRDFISNISHELRTPLASLKALVETLHDGALNDPPAARRFLSRMETEIDALSQMVQELLELSRIESGQVPLRLKACHVEEVILPAVERLQAQADRAGIDVSVQIEEGLPPVLADPERAQQVVGNLLHNAIKFTPAGGHVRISAGREGGLVHIAVADTGIGIPAEALPRIFERFFKADRARSGGGTGLGLAIARHLVQAHGGTIWAESVEGEGSTFHFTLPIASDVS